MTKIVRLSDHFYFIKNKKEQYSTGVIANDKFNRLIFTSHHFF